MNCFDYICCPDIANSFVDFVLLRRLGEDDDGRFYRRTTRLLALRLIDRNSRFCI
ncbi:MAG: hypothetical protein ACFCU8_14990 [Thermosynechococcaceae cyanobacterium]